VAHKAAPFFALYEAFSQGFIQINGDIQMTKLDVINAMLATLGELPLNELDARHPTVASGLRIIDQKSRAIQLNAGAGFWFNNIAAYSLKVYIDGKVAVPADLIKFTATAYPDRYAVINGYLWDNLADTDVIGESVTVSDIRCLTFEDSPVAAQDAISYAAIKAFSRDFEGDMQKLVDIKEDSNTAWVLLRAQNIREQRANTQRNPQVAQALAGFSRNPSNASLYTFV
jgi:hypothetical protein